MPTGFEEGVSVLICSRNGKKNLSPTLTAISKQKVQPDIAWEIIFVDNASTDNTGDVAQNIWQSLNSTVPFRFFRRDIPGGKEKAVELGLSKARYAYVIMCDDDNWLDPDYVTIAYEVMSSNEGIGLLGGFGIPVFEDGDEPAWFKAFERCYAVGKQSDQNGEIRPSLEMRFLWGAGSVLNRKAYQTLINAGFKRIITEDRYPDIARCEDMEISQAIQLAGYKLWYDSRLIFRHFISKDKLSWDYLMRIAKPGAIVRPYLLLYSALRVLNLDAHDSDHFNRYRKIWQQYKRKYILGMIIAHLRPKNVMHSVRFFLERHSVGDQEYFVKMNKWYFLQGATRLSQGEFREFYDRLIQLKKNISPNY